MNIGIRNALTAITLLSLSACGGRSLASDEGRSELAKSGDNGSSGDAARQPADTRDEAGSGEAGTGEAGTNEPMASTGGASSKGGQRAKGGPPGMTRLR